MAASSRANSSLRGSDERILSTCSKATSARSAAISGGSPTKDIETIGGVLGLGGIGARLRRARLAVLGWCERLAGRVRVLRLIFWLAVLRRNGGCCRCRHRFCWWRWRRDGCARFCRRGNRRSESARSRCRRPGIRFRYCAINAAAPLGTTAGAADATQIGTFSIPGCRGYEQ